MRTPARRRRSALQPVPGWWQKRWPRRNRVVASIPPQPIAPPASNPAVDEALVALARAAGGEARRN